MDLAALVRSTQPKLSKMHCVKAKPIMWLLLQYDQLSLIQGVLLY